MKKMNNWHPDSSRHKWTGVLNRDEVENEMRKQVKCWLEIKGIDRRKQVENEQKVVIKWKSTETLKS